MGKSAKLHKRVASKKTASSPISQPQLKSVPSAKKRAGLTSKVKTRSGSSQRDHVHVLGGADYVTLLLGGRRKAADEALKLQLE